MKISIIKQFQNDSIEDFEIKVEKESLRIRKDYKEIIDIQILIQNNLLIAVIKYN
jgi:hypothetical protein